MSALFVLGYLALWALAGLAAYAAIEGARALDWGSSTAAGAWAAAGC
jgi:hypothetical protein